MLLTLIFLVGIFTFVLCLFHFVLFFLFGATKKLFLISCIIVVILAIFTGFFGMWGADSNFLLILGTIGGIICSYFVAIKYLVEFVCPHCGEWNEYKKNYKMIDKEWDSLDNVEVERKIYNRNHDHIGSFTDTEQQIRTHREQAWMVTCTKCGKGSIHTQHDIR